MLVTEFPLPRKRSVHFKVKVLQRRNCESVLN